MVDNHPFAAAYAILAWRNVKDTILFPSSIQYICGNGFWAGDTAPFTWIIYQLFRRNETSLRCWWIVVYTGSYFPFSECGKLKIEKKISRAFGKFILLSNVSGKGAEKLAHILPWLSANLLFHSLASPFPDLTRNSFNSTPIVLGAFCLINETPNSDATSKKIY